MPCRTPREQTCKVCGGKFMHPYRVTCSEKCESAIASATMAQTNREHASERMKKSNPMRRGDARQRMTATLKRIGHRPAVRGGNGNATPASVATLHAMLPSFALECSIPTRQPRGGGYPTVYKVDLGDWTRKVAIEVDGKSHGLLSRKEQDRKKDTLLADLGWIVLRFTNAEVLEDPRACAECAKAARW